MEPERATKRPEASPAGELPPGLADEVSFERLEYGKLCTSLDGPIEPGVESYPLAMSPGFSPAIEPFCRPWILGIGQDAGRVGHGTVLRCVRTGGRSVPLFCRLRQRAEAGEGAEGRRFWLGRYVYARGVDPFTGFMALEERPLRGITVQESRSAWAPVGVPRSLQPEVDSVLEGFLQTALEHVLSGIPVGVSRVADEATFFRWAAALWCLIPGPLRPLFSAGWAVSPSEAQALSFSWSPQRSPVLAVFDLDRGRWMPPDRVDLIAANGEVRSRPFQDDLLVPGRMFLRESFDWRDGCARLAGLEPRLDHLRGFDFGVRGTAAEPPWIVDMRSSWVWERLRGPGLRSLDHARVQLVERWLQGDPGSDPATLCLSTKQFFFPDSRRQLFTLGLRALGSSGRRPRADLIVWRSLDEDPAAHRFLQEASLLDQVGARVRLLQTLTRGDLPRILSALEEALQLGAAMDLPAAARERLSQALTRSLDDTAMLGSHRLLLTGSAVDEPYREWVVASAARLAVMLGTAPEKDYEKALDRLDELAGNPLIATLRRFRQRESPEDADVRTLRALGPEDAGRLGDRLLSLWKLRDLETLKRREALCAWIELVPPRTGDPLLVLLIAGPGLPTLKPEQRVALVEDISAHHVPPPLRSRVAALVLRDWYYFHQDCKPNNPGWSDLLKEWPAEAVLTLVGDPGKSQRRSAAPEVVEALAQLALTSPVLDARIEVQFERWKKSKKADPEVSRLLWEFCKRAIYCPGEIRIADVCRGLAEGELPKGDPVPPTESKLERAAWLVYSQSLSLPRGLWESAGQGWQIRFLLAAAPRSDLRPTPQQVAELIPFREWLRKHLENRNIHEDRFRSFAVASYRFHERIYTKDEWRPEYGESPLWAAFRGVPLRLQGHLRKALDSYSDGDPRSLVKLAHKYFQDIDFHLLPPGDQREVLQRLARAVLAPLMQAGRLSPADANLLIQAANQPQSASLFRRKRIEFQPDAFNALDLSGDERVIIVAKWFKPLLDLVWNRRCQDELVKAIHAVEPEVWR